MTDWQCASKTTRELLLAIHFLPSNHRLFLCHPPDPSGWSNAWKHVVRPCSDPRSSMFLCLQIAPFLSVRGFFKLHPPAGLPVFSNLGVPVVDRSWTTLSLPVPNSSTSIPSLPSWRRARGLVGTFDSSLQPDFLECLQLTPDGSISSKFPNDFPGHLQVTRHDCFPLLGFPASSSNFQLSGDMVVLE